MKMKTSPAKSLKKFKRLSMVSVSTPQFLYIKAVAVRKVRVKNKKKKNRHEWDSLDRITINRIFETIKRVKTVQGLKVRWVLIKNYLANTKTLVRIRAGSKLFCPTTFYCFVKTGKTFTTYQADKAANESDIPNDIRREIDDAADSDGGSVFRKKLLQATGLLEQARKNGEKI